MHVKVWLRRISRIIRFKGIVNDYRKSHTALSSILFHLMSRSQHTFRSNISRQERALGKPPSRNATLMRASITSVRVLVDTLHG